MRRAIGICRPCLGSHARSKAMVCPQVAALAGKKDAHVTHSYGSWVGRLANALAAHGRKTLRVTNTPFDGVFRARRHMSCQWCRPKFGMGAHRVVEDPGYSCVLGVAMGHRWRGSFEWKDRISKRRKKCSKYRFPHHSASPCFHRSASRASFHSWTTETLTQKGTAASSGTRSARCHLSYGSPS